MYIASIKLYYNSINLQLVVDSGSKVGKPVNLQFTKKVNKNSKPLKAEEYSCCLSFYLLAFQGTA